MTRAIIIGASSGIGRALARAMSAAGYELGLAARREPLLLELQRELPARSVVARIDVSDAGAAQLGMQQLIDELGGADIIVVNAGVGFINPELAWERDRETIAVNVLGFAALANWAARYFVAQGHGHLVGVSSIAALRGGTETAAYSASKAFVSNYLDGIRRTLRRKSARITVTEIQPGFVDTPLARGDALFWVASPEKAAAQILRAIERKRSHAYVTRRWRLIAWLLKLLPNAR